MYVKTFSIVINVYPPPAVHNHSNNLFFRLRNNKLYAFVILPEKNSYCKRNIFIYKRVSTLGYKETSSVKQ